jgi:hypothetical protein
MNITTQGHFNNLRGFPWHVHAFFILSGYSMASPMNPVSNTTLMRFLYSKSTEPLIFMYCNAGDYEQALLFLDANG